MYRQLLSLSLIGLLTFFISCGGGGNAAPNPEVTGIQPDSGPVGTAVTISGNGFSPEVSDNTVSFNGTTASISSAGEDELQTTVPEGATSGAISVTVGNTTVSGPNFTVEPVNTTGTLEVAVTTAGDTKDEDGYTLTVGADETETSDTSDITYFQLEQGSHEVEISGIAANCSLQGDNPNPFSITAGDTVFVTFNVDCQLALKNKIVFASNRSGNWELFSMETDGSEVQPLSAEGTMPSISPDGTKVTFIREEGGVNSVYTMNIDGSDLVKLTDTYDSYLPRWSPGGEQISFYSERNGEWDIYIINSDGSGEKQLIHDGTDYDQAWSPDGTTIAFVSAENSGGSNIYLMDTDGENVRQLTDQGSAQYLAWSPDGEYIAFTSRRDGNNEIYVMESDGSNQVRLTTDPSSDNSASWSPGSDRIVFRSMRDGNSEIYQINADGTDLTNLTNNGSGDDYPYWSPLQ